MRFSAILFGIIGLVMMTGCRMSETKKGHTLSIDQIEIVLSSISNVIVNRGPLLVSGDPSQLSEYLIGDLLDAQVRFAESSLPNLEDTEFVSTMDFDGLLVYEFNDEEFIALTCGTMDVESVTNTGVFLEELPLRSFKSLYIFQKDDGLWKMALELPIEVALTDWRYAQEWQRELVGDIDYYLYDDCLPLDEVYEGANEN